MKRTDGNIKTIASLRGQLAYARQRNIMIAAKQSTASVDLLIATLRQRYAKAVADPAYDESTPRDAEG